MTSTFESLKQLPCKNSNPQPPLETLSIKTSDIHSEEPHYFSLNDIEQNSEEDGVYDNLLDKGLFFPGRTSSYWWMVFAMLLPILDYLTDITNTAVSITSNRMHENILGYAMLLNLVITPMYVWLVFGDPVVENGIKTVCEKIIPHFHEADLCKYVSTVVCVLFSPLMVLYTEMATRIRFLKVTQNFRKISDGWTVKRLIRQSIKISGSSSEFPL